MVYTTVAPIHCCRKVTIKHSFFLNTAVISVVSAYIHVTCISKCNILHDFADPVIFAIKCFMKFSRKELKILPYSTY